MRINVTGPKIAAIEEAVRATRGEFSFFALLLRKDSPGMWDLVVSAKWLTDDRASVELFIDQVKARLTPAEVADFSRVVILDDGSEPALALVKQFRGVRGYKAVDAPIARGRLRKAYVVVAGKAKKPLTPIRSKLKKAAKKKETA